MEVAVALPDAYFASLGLPYLFAGPAYPPMPICDYFPTTSMAKLPGFIFPRRSPGAGGSNSALGRKILWVLRSRPKVRADFFVATFSTTVYLSGESSWMTVRWPSPQETKKVLSEGSKATASGPSQMAGLATTLPESASTTEETLSSHTAMRRRLLRSPARPEGDLQGASGHLWSSFRFCVSR